MNKNLRFTAALVAALALPAVSSAQTWTSWNANCSGAATGSMGSTTVSYIGPYNAIYDSALNACLADLDWVGGIGGPAQDYFAPSSAYTPTPDNPSFVQIVNVVNRQVRSGAITFSEAVIDPYIAFISVGTDSFPVTYSFDSPFQIVSYNAPGSDPHPYWGNNSTDFGDLSTWYTDLVGTEFSGVIQFKGSFTSLGFTVNTDENWHGFTVGAPNRVPSIVPEPSSVALLGLGLLAIGWTVRQRRRATNLN